MKATDVDWETGEVMYWALDSLDSSRPLQEQTDSLDEDLAQIRFPSGVIVDVGWYPMFAEDGAFAVLVIADEKSWDNPLMEQRCKSVATLLAALADAVALATRHGNPTP